MLKLLQLFLVFAFFTLEIPSASSLKYEESLSDMLTQCLQFQEKIFEPSRQKHECEKDNFSGNFTYIIQSMTTRFSRQKFHCFHFLKNSATTQLKFKIWFSHKQIKIDGYGFRNYKNIGDKFESKVFADKSFFIATGVRGFPFPEIFGFELNGVDKCPLCGKKPENLISRIGNDDEFEVFEWPWHVAIYQKASGSLSYKCSGALISGSAVATSGECYHRIPYNQKHSPRTETKSPPFHLISYNQFIFQHPV